MADVLITGAGGYLGRRIASAYLRETDLRPVLWLHAGPDLEERRRAVAAELGPDAGRVVWCAGDLADAEPFADVDTSELRSIVHSAAVTRFNVDAETARAVNEEGAAKALDLARSCDRLDSFGLLSTVYASGLTPGRVEETPLADGRAYANHYEASKHRAELDLEARGGDVPWRILRVATVVADDAGGGVGQQNAVHGTLKLLFYGLLSVLPGDERTPLYFVTANHVQAGVLAAMQRGRDGGVYHLSAKRDETIDLGGLLDLVMEEFGRDEDFTARRILRPLLCDESSFRGLEQSVLAMGGDVMADAVASIAPFAGQLFCAKDVATEELDRLLGSRPPSAEPLVRAVCGNLLATRWGRRGVA